MRRREFITLLGGAAAAWPLAALAQRAEQPRRVGLIFIGRESDPQMQARIRALREGLATHGWIEGRHAVRATELIALAPDVIVVNAMNAAKALKQAGAIPTVFVNLADPVGNGRSTAAIWDREKSPTHCLR
jgi:putative tryptophan/tyrosine transport system substrate-binding protein